MLAVHSASLGVGCRVTEAAWAAPVRANLLNATLDWLQVHHNVTSAGATERYYSKRARAHPFFHAGNKAASRQTPGAAAATVLTAIATLDNFQSAGGSFADEAATQQLLCRLGLNNEHLYEFPRELALCYGHGLRMFQYPVQLAPYLAWLALHAQAVHSYVEIGPRWGGTFIVVAEVLRRANPRLRSIAAVDPIGEAPLLGEQLVSSKSPL